MKKFILGIVLLIGTITTAQEITKSEKITGDYNGYISKFVKKNNGEIIYKDYYFAATTSNQFDKVMIILSKEQTTDFLTELKQLSNLTTTLQHEESTKINDFTIYGSSYKNTIAITKSGFAGFVYLNTKQIDKLIKGFEDYLKKETL